jgi:hypothetical protein
MQDLKRDPVPRMSPEALKAEVRRVLRAVGESPRSEEETALQARWPEPVLALSSAEREARVRRGQDTIILDDESAPGGKRGFVRAVLRVPLESENGQVYGVFVEVNREGYATLREAFQHKREARVWGTLATRLPLLEDALDSEVEILEDGSERRARVVAAKHDALRFGPAVGPR